MNLSVNCLPCGDWSFSDILPSLPVIPILPSLKDTCVLNFEMFALTNSYSGWLRINDKLCTFKLTSVLIISSAPKTVQNKRKDYIIPVNNWIKVTHEDKRR